MTTSLKDRVKAATERGTGPGGPALAGEHERTPDGQGEDQAAGHEQDATEGVMEWLRRYEDHFNEALPSHLETGPFFAAVRAILPKLTRCTPASKLQALLTCARFGLVPDGQQAVVTASGGVATFIPTYRGFVELMYRSGRVDSVHVGMIHEADEWSIEPTAPPPLDFTHKPRPELPKAERGPEILAYAFCWMKNGARSQVVVLSREDAEAIRDEYSEAYRRAEETGARDSFWHTDFPAMWLKSAIRRLEKVVPTSAELRALGAADEAGEAGQVQILHAPDPEAEALVAEAERAHRAAEASQDTSVRPLPVKGSKRGRSKPKRNRGGRGRKASA
ncbi:recombinase RecT [Streptomyces sp. ISL-96]|uniref:recombinase RecT n=1 Tax=Streptomyces sp. ISL-96 TaxID=2819191 RepID=UPI001BEAAD37|nr:recombinase RecT [Streptomyces sp. ISL-96]MBT2492323.1 recombinase RecT [Streptomyces sp. ISL-96]